MNAHEFAALPLDRQLVHLRTTLAPDTSRALLLLCAAIRDHAPLAWMARQLRDMGWFLHHDNQRWFSEFLLARSETAVHQILRELTRELHLVAEDTRSAITAALVLALQTIELHAVSTMCLIDRALKHNAPEAREAHVNWVITQVCSALERGDLDAVTLDLLAQMPARTNQRMRALATAHGPAFVKALDEKRRRMAATAISVLGNAPKAVSQANAEELLARRVYTDPGHFLIELLQNAEDAGARTWKVVFDQDRIVVWHDGAAFDARDLVGVTSIGQTTKRKQQIGFFGVGFKSVFEVTDRPQVYSDVFNFEIADVSIPKALGERPPDVPRDGTVLVLPLRAPDDPVRSPQGLFEKARSLDPCVLFTLPHIEIIDLSLTESVPGGPRRHVIREQHNRWSSIRQSPDGWEKHYILQTDEFSYTQGHREAGRADTTRIMVGVLLDSLGIPTALGSDAATIYSYLPTDEHSGLAFWIQGHFDVPVDRERITADSAWNQWILNAVPGQLARIARQIVTQDRLPPSLRQRMAAGLLAILPLARELSNPIFHIIVHGLLQAFADVPVVPVVGQSLATPREAVVVATPALRVLFGSEPLAARLLEGDRDSSSAHDRKLHFADPILGARAIEILGHLGCPTLDSARLIDVLERVLHGVADGSLPQGDDVPSFLRAADLDKLRRLYDLLLAEIERLERDDEEERAGLSLSRLQALPLVCDDTATLHRPTRVARGNPAMRRIYEGLRTFVHSMIDPDVASDPGARTWARRLLPMWERLGVAVLDVNTLVGDLEAALAHAPRPLPALEHTSLPGSPERLELIVAEILATASMSLQRRLAALPLWQGTDGRFWPAATHASDDHGALLYEPGQASEALLAFYRDARPVLAPAAARQASGALLRQLRVPALDVERLVADIVRIPEMMNLGDPARLEELHTLLEELHAEAPERLRRSLAELPIWPDRAGRPGVLRSAQGQRAELVRIPADEQVIALFPDVRFLDAAVSARRHVRDMGIDSLGVAAVVDALEPRARAPLRIVPSPSTLAMVHRFLVDRIGDVGAGVRAKLVVVPAFLDDSGEVCQLASLCVADATLRAIYERGGSALRRFIDPDGLSMKLVSALELESHLVRADAAMLIDDLVRIAPQLMGAAPDGAPLVASTDNLGRILAYIAERTHELTRSLLDRVVEAPIVPDQDGVLGVLADPRQGLRRAAASGAIVLAEPSIQPVLVAAGMRVVGDEHASPVARIAHAAGLAPVDLELLVERLKSATRVMPHGPRHVLQGTPALRALYALLVARRSELVEQYPISPRQGLERASAVLGGLCIWETRAGGVVDADTLVDIEPIVQLIDHHEIDDQTRAALDSVAVHEEAHAAWNALGPLIAPRPRAAYIAELTRRLGREGMPLSHQVSLFGSTERIARLLELFLSDFRGTSQGEHPRPVPLVDATGALRVTALAACDRATVSVIDGLPCCRDVLHPDLHDEALIAALGLDELEPARVIEAVAAGQETGAPGQRAAAHPALHSGDRRARLYSWLAAHERRIFSDAACRELLETARLFITERGTLLSAMELVIDPDLPDLGIDWTPGAEIPEAVLSLLTRHLGAGSPDVEELIERHLLAAYHQAVREDHRERAGSIVRYLARALADHSVSEIGALLQAQGPRSVLIEDEYGVFRPPGELIMPAPQIEPHVAAVWGADYARPSPDRYPESTHRLLIALGVSTEPSVDRVRAAMQRPGLSRDAALGLAAICGRLHWLLGDAIITDVPLRQAAWLLDGTGRPRRPSELFSWAAEIEALIGSSGDLYPDTEAVRLLGDALVGTLGLRRIETIELDHIVRHLDRCIAATSPLPFRVYQWMEQGLSAGWLDASRLRAELQHRTWIWAQDRYFHHSRVIGSWAVSYFGDRRGYWERGHQECPTLCQLVAIPRDADVASVIAFLHEIAGEIERRGDRAALEQEPALRHMLLACHGLLGREREAVEPTIPVILCVQRGPSAEQGDALRILPAGSVQVFRSDTPTLERLFDDVGRFYLVVRGTGDNHADIDAFHELMGIRRLRSAFTVAVDASSGRDVTSAWAEAIQRLRSTLRALHSVLPRIRKQREHLAAEGWLSDELLEPLTTTRPIRVIENLRVRYRLDGVGDARADILAAYDRTSHQLVVDAEVLASPHRHTTGLALGLMSCIYDGPGEDQLVDIIEILLPMGSREAMDAYLDRRHFPVVDQRGASDPVDRIAERIGQILDYGLGQHLRRHFAAELGAADLETWREPSLLSALREATAGPQSLVAHAERAALVLLDAVGVASPSEPLRQALTMLLSGKGLSEIRPDFLSRSEDHEPLLPDIQRPAGASPFQPALPPLAETPFRGSSHASIDASDRDTSDLSSEELDEIHAQIMKRLGTRPGEPLAVPPAQPPSVRPPEQAMNDSDFSLAELARHMNTNASSPESSDNADIALDAWNALSGSSGVQVSHRPEIAPRSLWQRITSWFGGGAPDPVVFARPSWADAEANCLAPAPGIPSQLWATPQAFDDIAARTPAAVVRFTPPRLPSPWLYAPQSIGTTFDPEVQAWSSSGAPTIARWVRDSRPTGRSVEFVGRIVPGLSQLPLPLHGRLAGPVVVEAMGAPDTRIDVLGADRDDGRLLVQLHGSQPASVRYAVDLYETPPVTSASARGAGRLPVPAPSTSLGDLPREIQRWLERRRREHLEPWNLALLVQELVQRRYIYDAHFMERPEVEDARAGLRAGRGNHHVNLLHASGDESYLGRGICYELNILVVELLRHLDIAAYPVTGWVLDDGVLSRPDHLFALAIVPSAQGPCAVPLDAAIDRQGPIRELARRDGRVASDIHAMAHALPHIYENFGDSVPAHLDYRDRLAELGRDLTAGQAILKQLTDAATLKLGHPALTGALMAVMRGELDNVQSIPPRVRELVSMGLVSLRGVPAYRATLAWSGSGVGDDEDSTGP